MSVRYAGKLRGKWDVYVDDEMVPGKLWLGIRMSDGKQDDKGRGRPSEEERAGNYPCSRCGAQTEFGEPFCSGCEKIRDEEMLGRPINELPPAKAVYLKEGENLSNPDPTAEELAAALGRLVAGKNDRYGDSFKRAGEVLKILYPDGVRPEQYGDMLAVARIIDKLFRIATKDELGDDEESPYLDLSGYGLLGALRDRAEIGPDGLPLFKSEPF